MSEIKISIGDQYLQAFLAFLETLNYIQVEKVTKKDKGGKAKPKTGNATESFLRPNSAAPDRQTVLKIPVPLERAQ